MTFIFFVGEPGEMDLDEWFLMIDTEVTDRLGTVWKLWRTPVNRSC